MTGIKSLDKLLESMSPKLDFNDYVFCTSSNGTLKEFTTLSPIATFQEEEGLTLVLLKETADNAGFKYDGVFSKITLTVHSSLEAVGLTAAISNALAENDISANVIAAYYHDHVFVPKDSATSAVEVLKALSIANN